MKFLVVFLFILIGHFSGILSLTGNYLQSLNLLVYSVITVILLIWSFVLYSKAQNYEKTIAKQKTELQKEIEKRENVIQELHHTHKQLSSTSGYLERIIQESSDLITAVDRDYRYISFNNAFRESMKTFFEIDVEVGVKLDDILSDYPNKLKDAKAFWKRSLSGETFTAEQFFTEENGDLNVYELSYSPIKDKTGKIIGASQIARNVTKRNQESEQIKRERDFASAVFDVNKSLIIVLNRDGRIVRFNKACELVSGYTEEEIKGRIIWNVLIPSEDVATVKKGLKDWERTDFNRDYTSKWITKDEKVRHISWQISPIKDEYGISKFMVATGIDITETRDIEIAQKRLIEILENSTDYISISNPKGQLYYLNSAGRKMVGLDEITEVSKLNTNNFHPKWVNDLIKKEAIPKAYKSGTWLGETAILTSEDTEIPTSQLLMAHRNDSGEVEFYSSVIRDTSYRNKIKEELAQAKEVALEKTKMGSEFLANMSHEIRTPMNGIVGLSELLLNTELSIKQKDFVESIQRSGDSLLTIINDILDFSKLEAGKLMFESIDFNLYQTIESTFELFSGSLNKKNLELCLQIDSNVPMNLVGDPGRLRQVLINFISNAVKFTSEGQIVVRVKLEEDGVSPIIYFLIEDTGIGISSNALRNLFKPYTQADKTIASKYGGTGLGLAISKQLITLMDGNLGASSKVGIGSKFWFTAKFQSQDNEAQKSLKTRDLKNKSILIVHQNETQSNVLRSITKSWGMIAETVVDVKNAIKLLKSAADLGEKFESVLIDLELSDDQSVSLIEQIRNTASLRATKIILILKRFDKEKIEYAKTIGINRFLTKPIKQTELFDSLVQIFSENKNEDAAINGTIEDRSEKLEKFINEGTSTMNLTTDTTGRILIAEDNLVNQKVILNQVTGLGYNVDIVSNGKEAIDALQLRDYSLILMDCQMPVMDGFTATKKIRQKEKAENKHTPIIAVTAHAIEGDKERCLSIGMDDYISKPTKQQVLAKAISFWLHKSTQEIISKPQPEVAPIIPPKSNPANSEAENIRERLNELEESCGRATVLDCINLFLEDSEELINEITSAVDRNNFEKIAVDAHKLKGSSSNMGAVRLPKFSQKIISLSKENKSASVKLIHKQIVDEFEFIKAIYLGLKTEYEDSVTNFQKA